MPKIKPFKGIHPNQLYAGRVVVDLENLSLEEAKFIRQENPYSYVNMLVPKLDNLFLMGSKKALTYKKINENFEEFIDKEILLKDPEASVYVYRIIREGRVQTGIWTITSIDDYLSNVVKKHELTRADREQSLITYLQQTGIDANPVLITYHARPEIDSIIMETVGKKPDLSFVKDDTIHKLWKIDREKSIDALKDAFSSLPSSYIADGHHRAAAASLLGIERRKLNLKHQGDEEYNFFASVYMSTDQLQIYGFNRLIKDLNGLSEDDFLKRLSEHFSIRKCINSKFVIPDSLHHFGMYLTGDWYHLIAKPDTYSKDSPVAELDVAILQDYILDPLLKIKDPRTDHRISFIAGLLPVIGLISKVDAGDFAVAFVMYPTTIDQLIRVADSGEVMPPKSTCFEPKFQVGLLVHQIN